MLQQDLHNVAAPVQARHVDGGEQVLGRLVWVCAIHEKKNHARCFAAKSSSIQRRLRVLVWHIHHSAIFDAQVQNIEVAVRVRCVHLCREVQRGVSLLVHNFHVCTALQQQDACLHLRVDQRAVQRREPVVVLRVNVCLAPQYLLAQVDIPLTRCNVERCLPRLGVNKAHRRNSQRWQRPPRLHQVEQVGHILGRQRGRNHFLVLNDFVLDGEPKAVQLFFVSLLQQADSRLVVGAPRNVSGRPVFARKATVCPVAEEGGYELEAALDDGCVESGKAAGSCDNIGVCALVQQEHGSSQTGVQDGVVQRRLVLAVHAVEVGAPLEQQVNKAKEGKVVNIHLDGIM
mmetsp:Transcript_41831/g.105495  ORF Transcript_41831/g.105495 Transcript_41831/m.105495 type:complete len:344 (-) Transcript_41831:475-1506(-)